jgi:CarD family transcriptional regulator
VKGGGGARPGATAPAKKPVAAPAASAQAKKAAAGKAAPPVKASEVRKAPSSAQGKVGAAKQTVSQAAPAAKALRAPGAQRPITVTAQAAVRVAAALAKAPGQKLTAPVQPATPKAIAEKAAAARMAMAAQKKPVSQRHGFKTNEFIVYPAHGVGRIIGIEEQEIAGMSLELFVINFEKEKLTLRVPTGKLQSVGMRKLADEGVVKKAMETLKGRARVKRTMWSRRAQEYVAKINSGDLVSIAEVVRDLYRSEAQPEQSYSERQLYEDALDRMAREIAAVEKLDERGAVQRITEVLAKSARGRRLAEAADAEIKAA